MVKEAQLELIDLKVIQGSSKTIRGAVDYPEGGVTLRTCAEVNKRIVFRLTEEGIPVEDYRVEINSPGLDRPLKEYKDFLKAKGRFVLLWLNEPVEGKEYLEGELKEVGVDKIVISAKDNNFKIDLKKIKLGKEKIMIKGG